MIPRDMIIASGSGGTLFVAESMFARNMAISLDVCCRIVLWKIAMLAVAYMTLAQKLVIIPSSVLTHSGLG